MVVVEVETRRRRGAAVARVVPAKGERAAILAPFLLYPCRWPRGGRLRSVEGWGPKPLVAVVVVGVVSLAAARGVVIVVSRVTM